MTIPNFLNEAFQHGLHEHMALRDEKTKYFEDAKDHPGGEEERAHLTKLHSKAVGSDSAGRMIRGYTSHSKRINEGLIKNNGTPEPIHKAVHEGLMAVHGKAAPLERDHHVYSSLGTFDPSTVLGSSKVFRTPAHISASTKPAVATSHANMRRDWKSEPTDEHIMHFHLPAGHKGATYIAGRSHYPEESEMLIKPNSHFKVHDVTKIKLSNGTTRHVWHVKPHDPTLKEALEHEPNIYRDMSGRHLDSSHWEKHTAAHDEARNRVSSSVFDHHTELMKTAPQKDDFKEHTMPLRSYCYGSNHINTALLDHHAGKHIPDHEHPAFHRDLEHADKVSASLNHHATPLESEGHMYSGISQEHAEHLKEGGVFKTPAFTSTSISPSQAIRFAKPKTPAAKVDGNDIKSADHRHVIHFKLPKGYKKGVYVAGISAAPGESEYLLDKGQHWKVTGKKVTHQSNVSMRDSGVGKVHLKQHIHVWTVEPHEPHLHEATYHEPKTFGGYSITSKDRESGNMHSPLYAMGNTPRALKYNTHHDRILNDVRTDVKQQHEHLMKTAPGVRSHEDIPHAEALRSHTINSSYTNHALLRQHSKTGREHDAAYLHDADKVSAAIKHFSSPTDHEMHVYSGLKHDAIKKAHDAGHDTIHMPAFTSTTINPRCANGFASDMLSKHVPGDRGTGITGIDHIAHFKLPKGYTKGAYLEGVSEHKNEKEYLLDKGQTWKITGHKRVTKTHSSTVGGNSKDVTHTHIWTLEPHDEHPGGGKLHESEDMTNKLDEAVRHSEHFFSGTMGFDKVHGHSALVKHTGDGGKIDFAPDHGELQKQHSSLRNSHKVVDHDAAQIIHKYTGNSAKVNKHLLAPKVMSFMGREHEHHAQAMSDAIARHAKPLRHDVHVYSGLGNHNPTKDFDKTGTVHLPAFTSTSLNPTVALAFGPDKPMKQETHILHFHLPKGYKKSLYVAGHSAVKDEREMLLDKGQKWQLTGVKKSRVKVEYGKSLGYKDHHRDVTVWSLRPHHSQLHEALQHDPHHTGFTTPHEMEDMHDMGLDSTEHFEHEHAHLAKLHDVEAHEYEDHWNHVAQWSESSRHINQHLISGGKKKIDPDAHETMQHMHKMVATAKPLEQTHHVYSGMGTFDPSKHLTGSDGHMKTAGFISTSLNPEVAGIHAKGSKPAKETHVAHFELPKGYKGARYIGNYSHYMDEHEMVIGPNQRFKKTGESVVHHDDGRKVTVHSFKPA